MFTLTDSAKKELDAFFSDKEKAIVRIYLAAGGCSGPRLGMALDEERDNDSKFSEQGYEFCIDNALLEQTRGVTVDAGYMGFMVTPAQELPGGGCASCGGSCGTN